MKQKKREEEAWRSFTWWIIQYKIMIIYLLSFLTCVKMLRTSGVALWVWFILITCCSSLGNMILQSNNYTSANMAFYVFNEELNDGRRMKGFLELVEREKDLFARWRSDGKAKISDESNSLRIRHYVEKVLQKNLWIS